MTFMETMLAIGVVLFIALIVWSRIQDQKMLDTANEIKEIAKSWFGGAAEKVNPTNKV